MQWNVRRSVMSDSVTLWTVSRKTPLSMEFSRQEYWSVFPFPTTGDLSSPGIKPGSPPLQADSLPFDSPCNPYHSAELPQIFNFFKKKSNTNKTRATKKSTSSEKCNEAQSSKMRSVCILGRGKTVQTLQKWSTVTSTVVCAEMVPIDVDQA